MTTQIKPFIRAHLSRRSFSEGGFVVKEMKT